MAECKDCLKRVKTINVNDLQITCDKCKDVFHGSCVGIKKEEMDYLAKEKQTWFCKRCMAASKASKYETSNVSPDQFQLIMNQLNTINDKIKSQAELIATFNDKMEHRLTMVEEALKQIESLTKENIELKSNLVQCTSRLDHLEQQLRLNWVELHGIPNFQNMSVKQQAVTCFSKCLDITVAEDDIKSCYRISSKSANHSTSQSPGNSDNHVNKILPIIVKFHSEKLKRQVMAAKIKKYKNLNASVLDDTLTASPIYINESLTPTRRQLLALCRRVKRSKKYYSIFTVNGEIMMKKNKDDDDVVVIRSVRDIANLN